MERSLRDWRDVGDGECAVQPGFHPFGLCPVYGTGCDREKCPHWKHDIPTEGSHYMTREERRTARFQEGARAMTADEREAMRAALDAAMELKDPLERWNILDAIEGVGAAAGRSEQRRRSDAATDRKRRQLVGARMPIEIADRCRDCAARTGVSLYRWVYDALVKAMEETQ